uniref:DUF4283 domain-containing protein n=1 Tax=Kalanchoe fedtschenkoi TaxID=63787 RepID=A0A7N0VIJ5_KALFE
MKNNFVYWRDKHHIAGPRDQDHAPYYCIPISLPRQNCSSSAVIALIPDLFNEGILRCLCQPFRRFLDTDMHTKNRTRCSFARCCVEIDVTKSLPGEIWIETGDGHGWWQEVIYEGNLKFCSRCKIHGHTLAECRKARTKPPGKITQETINERKDIGEQGKKIQEWIPVNKGKKETPSAVIQPAEAVQVEEGEIREEPSKNSPNGNIILEQPLPSLKRCHSLGQIEEDSDNFGIKHTYVLERSNSMSDLLNRYKDRKTDFIYEDFMHIHRIRKQLLKAKEENIRRRKLMEAKTDQQTIHLNTHPTEVINNLELISQVPQTQLPEVQSQEAPKEILETKTNKAKIKSNNLMWTEGLLQEPLQETNLNTHHSDTSTPLGDDRNTGSRQSQALEKRLELIYRIKPQIPGKRLCDFLLLAVHFG